MIVSYIKNEKSFIKPTEVFIEIEGDQTLVFNQKTKNCICNGISELDLVKFNSMSDATIWFNNQIKQFPEIKEILTRQKKVL